MKDTPKTLQPWGAQALESKVSGRWQVKSARCWKDNSQDFSFFLHGTVHSDADLMLRISHGSNKSKEPRSQSIDRGRERQREGVRQKAKLLYRFRQNGLLTIIG